MKALGPLFLDQLDQAIERVWDRAMAQRRLQERVAHIRVFDPALRVWQLPRCRLRRTQGARSVDPGALRS